MARSWQRPHLHWERNRGWSSYRWSCRVAGAQTGRLECGGGQGGEVTQDSPTGLPSFLCLLSLSSGIEPEQTPLGSHLWSPPCTSCIRGHLPLHHRLGLAPGLGTSSHSGAQITASFPSWRRAFHLPCLHPPCSPGPSHAWHMALSSVG